MSQKKPRIRIGLTLEGDMAQRFLKLKEKWGLESSSDVLRMLITKAYDDMRRELGH
mgnify:CR=1 FL=1